MTGVSDASYATCKDTRKSVTEYIVYLEGAPIAIKSGMQKIIALSSSEAELIALVQCLQEIMFMKKVLESMELQVELPILIKCDNKGTVDLINGHAVGGGTKHIDIRMYYARDLKDKGIIKVVWVPTDENEADIFTKNTGKNTFLKHIKC